MASTRAVPGGGRRLVRLADSRRRTAFCPLHPNDRMPAMSVYERAGKPRAHCFGCDFDGDALDLEAAIIGEDLATTIRRWSS